MFMNAVFCLYNNYILGIDNKMPWEVFPELRDTPEVKADLKLFKHLTKDAIIVMGRKTWDSLPKKPLLNRLNIVITSQERHFEEMTAFIPFSEAVSRLKHSPKDDDWFIIGGGQIYKELLPYCDRVYVTKIYKDHDQVDTYFLNLDESEEWAPATCSDIRQ